MAEVVQVGHIPAIIIFNNPFFMKIWEFFRSKIFIFHIFLVETFDLLEKKAIWWGGFSVYFVQKYHRNRAPPSFNYALKSCGRAGVEDWFLNLIVENFRKLLFLSKYHWKPKIFIKFF